ncbi:MAG: tyrosine-protein phosphatase [Gemmataceae bacterium]
MLPLADMHVHLLAGLDDGPRTRGDAVAMCQAAHAEGVRLAAALAHQNESWPAVTPAVIRAAAKQLTHDLAAAGVDLRVFPTAEVMVRPGLEDEWRAGTLMSVADRGELLLLEMPHQLFVDLRQTVAGLRRLGVRTILAHPERTPELLHEPGAVERLIGLGCLVQVSATSVTEPPSAQDERALRDWVRRGVVHLLGSDGHSANRRPPRLAAAVETIARWAGPAAADRIGWAVGLAVLHGLPLRVPPPQPPGRRWWALGGLLSRT